MFWDDIEEEKSSHYFNNDQLKEIMDLAELSFENPTYEKTPQLIYICNKAAEKGIILNNYVRGLLADELKINANAKSKFCEYTVKFAPKMISFGTQNLESKSDIRWGNVGIKSGRELLISNDLYGVKKYPLFNMTLENGEVKWRIGLFDVSPAIEIDYNLASKLKALKCSNPELFKYNSHKLHLALRNAIALHPDGLVKEAMNVNLSNYPIETEETNLLVKTDLDGVTRFEFDKTIFMFWQEEQTVLHYGRGSRLYKVFDSLVNPFLDKILAPQIKDIFNQTYSQNSYNVKE